MKRIQIGSRLQKAVQIVMVFLTICYGVYAFYLLILGSRYRSFGIGWSPLSRNFIPFKTISIYLFNPHHLSWGIIFDNLIGNILVFMPLGFFAALFSKKMRNVLRIIILSFIMTVAVEFTQGVLGVGSVDIDDVILNTLGGLVGYNCFLICYKILSCLFDWENIPVKHDREQ